MLFSVPIKNFRKQRKNGGDVRQIYCMEGPSFRTGLRLLSVLLCMTLLAGFFSVQSAASGIVSGTAGTASGLSGTAFGSFGTASGTPAGADAGQPVTLTDLGELDAPETYPAKGALCLQVARSKSIGADGGTSYLYEEAYLPVVVAEDHSVYGELDTLAGLLDMNVQYFDSTALVTFFETDVYLALGDPQAGYTTPLFSVMAEMGRAPVLLDQMWYVPLDEFLSLTGTIQKYGETNWLGKQQLALIPPQRTVLDDIGIFYRDAYSRYAFSYVKDLGYAEDQAAELAGQASVIQYVEGIGSLDLRTWLAIAFGRYTRAAIDYYENGYGEAFMNRLLQENEEIAVEWVEGGKKVLDYMGCMLDICASTMKTSGAAASGAAAAAAGSAAASGTAGVQAALSEAKTALSQQGAGNFLGEYGNYITAWQNAATGLSHLTTLATLFMTFGNVDEQMVETAELFYEKKDLLPERTMREEQYRMVEKKIGQFSGSSANAAVTQFFLDNGARLFLDVGAIMEYAVAKKLAGGSALWSAAANLVGGEEIRASDSFLIGMFGMQYEADAVALARQELDDIFFGKEASALSETREEEIRDLVFHAAKACMVTRTYGCAGCPALLEKYPELQEKQNEINEELASIAANVSNRMIPFGRLPGQLRTAGPYRQEHYKNVLYNFCGLRGQILDWKNERPAKNVRVEVVSKSGKVLSEFVTDKNGRFEAEFALEEINVWEQTPLVQELTLHLYYKRNPVVLEDIQADYFHSYEVNGLHVGRKTVETLAYVLGASTQDGQTAVEILRFELDEAAIGFDAPDGFGGSYPAYVALPGQLHTASDAETVLLKEGVELETLYGRLIPEGSMLRGMLDYANEADGIGGSGVTQASLSDAQAIQEYVDAYYEVNGQYPSFLLEMVNSLIVSGEVALVDADETDIPH